MAALTLTVLANNMYTVTVFVDKPTAKIGDTVTATCSVSGTPKIKSMALTFFYDKTSLRLKSGTWLVDATLKNVNVSKAVAAMGVEDEKVISGDVLTLQFEVIGEFASTAISVSPVMKNMAETLECQGIPVEIEYAADCMPGDLTGDGEIDSLDGLMLMRYLNGWDVEITCTDAMDVNGDGEVDSLDGLLLMRYLNGWDVKLGS